MEESAAPPGDHYDVYLRGNKQNQIDGLVALTQRIAAEFGIPSKPLLLRLEKGPVRVKSRVSQEMARRYVDKLEKLGGWAEMISHGKDLPPSWIAFTETAAKRPLVAIDGSPLGGPQQPKDDGPSFPAFSPPTFSPELAPVELEGTESLGAIDTRDISLAAQPDVRLKVLASAPDVVPDRLTPRPIPPRVGAAEPLARRRGNAAVTFDANHDDWMALSGRSIRSRPGLRFTVAFVLGLAAGFVPAWFYATGVRHEELKPLLTRDMALAAAPPSAADPTHRQELRVRIRAVKLRSSFAIIAIWVVVGGFVGITAYRFV